MLGARAAFVQDVVRPALEKGRIVLADRFDLSTYAYQGFGRGLDLEQVRQANQMATGGLTPDLYLVLDLPVDQGLERKGGGEGGDRIEREGSSFLAKVGEGYRTLAGQIPQTRLVSAGGSPGEVQKALRKILAETFPETFSAKEV